MKFRTAIMLATGVSAIATAAHAQTTPPSPTQTPAPAAPTTTAAGPSIPDIIVTGSRVVSNGNKSPTPVTVVSTKLLLSVQPTTVVEAVTLQPALQGSQGTSSNPGGGQRNGAAAYIALRDLGDLRTLVLMNGQRVVPTINQNEGNTDSWVIPQMLIERVDVVTGGVSAVYGSDAVSGVVNFITNNHLEGINFQASSGISTYGDDWERDIGIAAGTKFAGGNGHFEMSYEYRNDPGIPNQLSRPWAAATLSGAGLGTTASPYYNITNARISTTSFGGLIRSGPYSGQQFAQNGVLSPFAVGTSTGTSGVSSGGDGGWYDTASLKSSQEFHQVFARGDYDFSDKVHGFLQIAATFDHTGDSYRAPLENVNIGYNNPYIQNVAGLGTLYNPASTGSFSFSKLFNIPATAVQQTDTYMLHGGLDGSIGKFKWDIGFGQSQSTITATNDANVNQGRFLAASNVVAGPGGTPVCAASATNPTYAGCVPLNMFGPNAYSQAALNYVLESTWNKNTTTLTDVSAGIHGPVFNDWAGPVNMSLSGEFRRTGWGVTSNASPSDPVSCAGIQFSCTSTTAPYLQTTMPALATVHQNVAEIAYETQVPLLTDVAFARSLDLNGAVRYTNYSTSGGATTWKVGLIWKPVDDLTIRSTASRDIRAPNLFELYAPTTIAPTTIVDPVSGSSGMVGVSTVSNAHLTPEKTNSFTGGFVYTPHFLPGFSFSVDAFYIKVNNAISQLSGVSTSTLSLCAADPSNAACATIVRPTPTSFPSALYNEYLNIASLKTWGADFESDYATRIAGHGFSLRALLSWQPHLIFNQGPAGTIDLGNTATGVSLYPATPAIKYNVIASFNVSDQFSITAMQHGRGAMKAVGVVDGQAQKVFADGIGKDPAATYTNLTFSWTVPIDSHDRKTEFYFNIQNLFNKSPNNLDFAGANSSPGVGLNGFFAPNGDDIVGRYFTVGLRAHI